MLISDALARSCSPKESPVPEYPMRQWNVKLYILDQDGNKHPATCFNKVVYNLHPSFENPHQSASAHAAPCRKTLQNRAMLTLSITCR